MLSEKIIYNYYIFPEEKKKLSSLFLWNFPGKDDISEGNHLKVWAFPKGAIHSPSPGYILQVLLRHWFQCPPDPSQWPSPGTWTWINRKLILLQKRKKNIFPSFCFWWPGRNVGHELPMPEIKGTTKELDHPI